VEGILSLRHCRVQTSSGANPPFYTVGTRPHSWSVKLPGREANNSPASNAEFKNAWNYTSTPQYVFVAWYFVKRRGNFTFTFQLYVVGSLWDANLNQLNLIRNFTPHSSGTNFNIIHSSTFRCPKRSLLPLRFSVYNLYASHLSHTCYMSRPPHP